MKLNPSRGLPTPWQKLIAFGRTFLMIGGVICIPIVMTGILDEYFNVTVVRLPRKQCSSPDPSFDTHEWHDLHAKKSSSRDPSFSADERHDLHAVIKDLLQDIAAARRYARSSITNNLLGEAFIKGKVTLGLIDKYTHKLIAETALIQTDNQLKVSADNSSKIILQRSELLVCPEVYRGQRYDYPDHTKSMNSNCTDVYRVKPLSESLSIVLNFFNEIDPKLAKPIFEGIENSLYKKLPIIVIRAKSQSIPTSGLNTREIIPDSNKPNLFEEYVLPHVTTPYVLFSRRLERFDRFAMLERLVRVASYLNVDVVGGSHRQSDGKWMNGCYQLSFRNYTVRMIEGYDLSYNSSLYCDYISGPFIAHVPKIRQVLQSRTNFSNEIKDDHTAMDIFYFDLFLALTLQKSIVMDCPDVMFHTRSAYFEGYTFDRDTWKPLAKNWYIQRLYFSDANVDINYSCKEIAFKCPEAGGVVLPPCCYKEHTDLFNFVASTFENAGILSFIDTGTLLGAVKISNTVPWPGDHDIALPADKRSEITKIFKTGIFEKQGYTWSKSGGNFDIRTRHSHIEVYLEGSKFFKNGKEEGINPTQVLLGGRWQICPTSPAMVSRNQYGLSAYEHAEPWYALGSNTGFHNYENTTHQGKFRPCPLQINQGCLNQYSTDGNLQFKDHWI